MFSAYCPLPHQVYSRRMQDEMELVNCRCAVHNRIRFSQGPRTFVISTCPRFQEKSGVDDRCKVVLPGSALFIPVRKLFFATPWRGTVQPGRVEALTQRCPLRFSRRFRLPSVDTTYFSFPLINGTGFLTAPKKTTDPRLPRSPKRRALPPQQRAGVAGEGRHHEARPREMAVSRQRGCRFVRRGGLLREPRFRLGRGRYTFFLFGPCKEHGRVAKQLQLLQQEWLRHLVLFLLS